MKKTADILNKIREIIYSDYFKNAFRLKDNYFTRSRLISLPFIILFLLNLVKKSLQIECNAIAFISSLKSFSKQAFSQARHKISPQAFVYLHEQLISEYYCDNQVRKFKDFLILSVDGTTLRLPDKKAITSIYGRRKCNATESCVLGRVSEVYDVLNQLTIRVDLFPYEIGERNIAQKQLNESCQILKQSGHRKLLYIYDRGYISKDFMWLHNQLEANFIMRCPIDFYWQLKYLIKDEETDVDIFLQIKNTKHEKINLQVRAIFIKLSTGETEILFTNLLDRNLYPHHIFKGLYHLRWSCEENYKRHKILTQIENFSGQTQIAVLQDFYATIFTHNVAMLLCKEAEDEQLSQLSKETTRNKHSYQINRCIAIGTLKNRLFEALIGEESLHLFCEQFKILISRSREPIRPERFYSREKAKMPKRHHAFRRCL